MGLRPDRYAWDRDETRLIITEGICPPQTNHLLAPVVRASAGVPCRPNAASSAGRGGGGGGGASKPSHPPPNALYNATNSRTTPSCATAYWSCNSNSCRSASSTLRKSLSPLLYRCVASVS